jgi:chorismate dehydratase
MAIVRIGFIKYANSLPLYHSFDSCGIIDSIKNALKTSGRAVNSSEDIEFELIYDSPARLNELISDGRLDIATISTYEYVKNRAGLQMIGNIGICAHKSVMSVLLISKININQLSGCNILLSDESASAVSLLKILTGDYFNNRGVKFITGKVRAEEIDKTISENNASAVMAIGDEALKYYELSKEANKIKIYDLCSLWNYFTSLPFVFGVFAARADFYFNNKIICDLAGDSVKSKINFFNLNKDIFADYSSKRSKISESIMRQYYETLSYNVTPEHIMALNEYEKRLKKINLLP